MGYLIAKYAITAALIVAASEIAKRSDRIGALILSLPVMTLITLFWLYVEDQPQDKIANHAWYTFWYVIPTLPMFLVFPMLIRQWGFAWAMLVFLLGTLVSFMCFSWILKRFGIYLL